MNKLTIAAISVLVLQAAVATANTRVVVRVHSGDLIEIEGGWVTRLTGISVPEPDETFGMQALDFSKRRIEGRTVAMFTWTTDNTAATIVRDENGRPFATIKFGTALDIDLAAVLLEKGLARVDEEHLPESLHHYREIERSARQNGLGIWSAPAPN